MPGLVGVLVTLGMAVVAPLGLARLSTLGLVTVRRLWPALGALAGGALLLPRGPVAVLLVLPYTAVCAAVTVHGLRRAVARRAARGPAGLREVTALTAAGSLLVAALSLVAERAGAELFGFSLAVHGLTVAHFHFAGFAAALLAGLTAVAAPGRTAAAGALAVPAGTALVAVGHFTGRWTELAGAVVLTAGLLATSWVAHARVAEGLRDRTARVLLRTAAWATPVTMALALWWAVGRATGLTHLTLTQTAATHGFLNAIGVGLCGLLAWHRAGAPRL